MSVRAMVVDELGSPEGMTLATVEEPGPGESSISVRAIGVNFPDLLVIGGTYQILPARAAGADYDALLGLYSKGLTKTHVSAAYPLEDAARALEEIRSGRAKGKSC